jgi:dihydrofolate reductase
MTRVRVESFAISLDGYGAGPNQDLNNPLGIGGTDLHQWFIPTRTSTTLTSASAWRNSTIIRDNVVDAVRRLKEQPGKNILLDGSSVLAQTLAQNDLIYEYALHVYPLVLGGGKRLFPAGKRLNLTLVETSPLPTGVVFMRYRRTAE